MISAISRFTVKWHFSVMSTHAQFTLIIMASWLRVLKPHPTSNCPNALLEQKNEFSRQTIEQNVTTSCFVCSTQNEMEIAHPSLTSVNVQNYESWSHIFTLWPAGTWMVVILVRSEDHVSFVVSFGFGPIIYFRETSAC